jgi:hypothetical protein
VALGVLDWAQSVAMAELPMRPVVLVAEGRVRWNRAHPLMAGQGGLHRLRPMAEPVVTAEEAMGVTADEPLAAAVDEWRSAPQV